MPLSIRVELICLHGLKYTKPANGHSGAAGRCSVEPSECGCSVQTGAKRVQIPTEGDGSSTNVILDGRVQTFVFLFIVMERVCDWEAVAIAVRGFQEALVIAAR